MVLLEKLKETDASFRICSMEKPVERITALCSPDQLHEGGIVFVKSKKYYDQLADKSGNDGFPKSMGVVFEESFFRTEKVSGRPAILKRFRFHATVESVDLAMSRFSKLFFDEHSRKGNDLVDGRVSGTARVHPGSSIAPNVFLGQGAEIAEGATILSGCVILSNSRIGRNTFLYPNVVVCRDVNIGQNCIIHANTTIGSDGFSYNFSNGMHLKVWHLGGVLIEDFVEIGSNTSIDQGTFSPTIIGQGSKIDNQVHIAHNCKLGKGVIICGQIGFSGSVTVGDYVVMGGAANIAPEVKIGNGARIGGMSGVTSHVPEKAVYGGHPARPLNEWLKSSATLRRISLKKNKNTGDSG